MTSLNEAILANSLVLAQQQLQGFAQSENFLSVLDSVFGTEYDRAQATAIQQAWQASDFSQLPEIQVLDSASMPGIQGGFSAQTGKIYINADFLANATADQITAVLIEEIGHSLDSQINVSDTLGDEGELFSAYVRGIEISEQELAAIKSGNDQMEVVVDGMPLALEASSQATYTVTFNNLSGTPSSYIEQGLKFSSDHLHTSDENNNGSPEVFGHSGGTDNIRIELAAGGKFSLFEIDTLAVPSWSGGSNNIIFTAYRDGVQVGQRNVPAGQHVVFGADFQNIDYIDWFSQSGALAIETLKFSARANNVPTLTGTKATLNAGAEDTAYTISASDLLIGFTDADGDTLSVSNLSASNGNLVVNNNGTYTFTPTANYNGNINLSYSVVDTYGGSVATTQSFTLATVNDAPDAPAVTQTFAFEYPQNSSSGYPPSFSENGFVFQGFTDYPYGYGVNNSGMTYTWASNNWATGGADGAIRRADGHDFSLKSFSAAAFSPYVATLLGFDDGVQVASRSISYAATHQSFTFDSSWNSIDEVRFNLPSNEVVNGTYYSGEYIFLDNLVVGAATSSTTLAAGTEDTAYTITTAQLLAGFTDVDGDTLSVANVKVNSTALTLDSNGNYVFNPPTNANGNFTVTYDVTDGTANTAASLGFSLTAVNDAPVLTGTEATLAVGAEDAPYTITKAQLLAGFTDVENNTLSVVNVKVDGTALTLNSDGNYVFNPPTNANGSFTVTYNVTDGTDNTAASLGFSLTAVNDAPALTGTKATLAVGREDTAYIVSAADLLAGFSDVDIATNGQVLSVTNLSTSNGTVTDNLDDTYTFTPVANYNGTVNLSYNVIDGNGGGGSVAATQSFTVDAVNDVPIGTASANLISGTEDTAYTIRAVDLLQGFSDVDGDTLAVADLVATDGTLINNNDGTYSFTPAANYNGSVNLSYNVIDGNGGTITVAQSITIAAVSDAPVVSKAIADQNTLEDSPFTFTIPADTFSDVDGDVLTYTATLENGDALPTWLSFDGTTLSGTPTNDEVGNLNIEVIASDGELSVSNVFNLAIANTNDAPTASNDSLITSEDTPLVISAATLLGNDVDVDLGDILSVSEFTQPSQGSLVENGNGTYNYTPNANYNGVDSFTYMVRDREGATSTATVNLTINAVNDNPDAINDIVTARQSTAKTILAADLLANDGDIEGDALNLTQVQNAQNGTVALDSNGNVVFTANANVATASFEYTLSDGQGGTDIAFVSVLVGMVDDGGNGQDTMNGTAGDDVLNGGNGDDILRGFAGDDKLLGGNGIDNFQGGEGKDWLYGGRGNDLLNGGLGRDTFVLISQNGTDTIQDFTDGEDQIGLAEGLTFGQLTVSSSNGNTLIAKNGGDVLAILSGVNSSLITQADFISVV
ncbi:cadherin-like domain-containing protein [Trichocoleus sp. FACHB-262]|uniref:cadherin-like domain-containing protein n=1 Tax=Trichocoleus sp. FACHB-262 TaxID=2692869 RepID=UPI0016841EDA|nr:cadherin-like domain-containing protein [Trichocoleus sp. FACHB-262]MBD2123235.1 cadherin-like domain-containing protein [Trichocoleus sp. FACHB-262]